MASKAKEPEKPRYGRGLEPDEWKALSESGVLYRVTGDGRILARRGDHQVVCLTLLKAAQELGVL